MLHIPRNHTFDRRAYGAATLATGNSVQVIIRSRSAFGSLAYPHHCFRVNENWHREGIWCQRLRRQRINKNVCSIRLTNCMRPGHSDIELNALTYIRRRRQYASWAFLNHSPSHRAFCMLPRLTFPI